MFYEKRRIFFAPIASLVESICMQPIDTIKVLRQSNQELPRNIKSYYKGFGPFVSQMSIKYFLRFSTFELSRGNKNVFHINFIAGILSGISESLFITPFELIKTNLQTTDNKSSLKIIYGKYSKDGLRSLYRGFYPTCLRQSINQAFNFSVYYELKQLIMSNDTKPNILKIAFASIISSSIGPILNNPFDVIKTRYMNPKYSYKSINCAYTDIVKNEGFAFLFNGLGLRIFRVSLGQAIIFVTVENLLYYTSR